MKRTQLFTIAALLFVSFSCQTSKSDYSSVLEDYILEIENTINKGQVKAISFALIDGNRIVFSGNYGFSDFENKIVADSNTVYGIGSISKLFTATSVLQLHEKGIINIDSAFTKYFPDFTVKQRFATDLEITPRMLLTHHSGLPSDITNGTFSKKPMHFGSTFDLLEKEYAPFAPNQVYLYSNIGYSLLGSLIEEAAATKYEEYVHENIFTPLGMSSAIVDGDNSIMQLKGYDEAGNEREEYGIRPVPAGAIKSIISDLAKFAMSFLPDYRGTRVLSRSSIKSMFTIQNQNIALDLGEKHGMPWFPGNNREAGQIYYHSGGTMNHRGLLMVAPESNLALVILSNSVNIGRFHRLSMNLLDSCARIKGRTLDVVPRDEVNSLDTVKASIEVLSKYEGVYANPSFVFRVVASENQLSTKIQGADYLLKPLSDGTFVPVVVSPTGSSQIMENVRFEFVTIEDNDILVYNNLVSQSKQLLGTRFDIQVIDSLWISRLGKYEILETDDNDHLFLSHFELTIEDGVLVFNQIENYEGADKWQTAIEVKDNNTAFSLGIGRHRGFTLQFESDNGEEILWFSGYKLRLIEE
jgi:CubicO group peptidase (beta-lactamase class C family)